MTLILSVVLTIICAIGIAFNGYTVLVILLTRQVNSANNILLLHLGIVNILIGILFLIFCLPGIKETEWASAGAPCAVNGFLFTLLHPLALWTICGLNCDRYYAIAAPLHYTHIVSTRKVLLGLFVGWVNSFLLAIPPLFNSAPYRYLPGLGACAPDFRAGNGPVWYAVAFAGFTLLLPATVFICCNAKVLIIARYHRHRIASAIFEVALSAQVTITHQRNPFFVPTVTAPSAGGPKIRGSNPILAVFLLVGSFLLMCVPYYVLVLYEAAAHIIKNNPGMLEPPSMNHFYMAAGTLLICSPAVNGYLYGLKNKCLRKAFMNYWRKKQTKNEVQHEIQARTPSTCGSRRPSLTPFGLFTRNPSVSRRMSETLMDVNKSLKSPHKSKIKRITSELMWRHSSGYLYGLKNKCLRKAFMNYWRKKQTKNEVQHEIQARTPSTCGSRRPSLTPFGLFTRNPSVSRRMSETLMDVNKSLKSPHKSKIKRITSELMWRHSSANSLNLSPKDELPSKSIKQTISCNTLRVPEEANTSADDEIRVALENDAIFESPTKSYSPGTLLQKIFKFEQDKVTKKSNNSPKSESESSPKRSPRILITRAFSEESDKNSQSSSPSREINKKHSNSASNLIEKKWRQVKYKDEDTDSSCTKSNSTTKPLLNSSTLSNRSSESSETSGSSGKIFINLDGRRMSMDTSEPESNEEQLLLTWNSHKRYARPEDARRSPKSTIVKVTVQTKEIVL